MDAINARNAIQSVYCGPERFVTQSILALYVTFRGTSVHNSVKPLAAWGDQIERLVCFPGKME